MAHLRRLGPTDDRAIGRGFVDAFSAACGVVECRVSTLGTWASGSGVTSGSHKAQQDSHIPTESGIRITSRSHVSALREALARILSAIN